MTSQVHHEMRPVSLINVSLINDAQIIERSLRHVGMWVGAVCNYGVRISPSMGPPVGEIIDRAQLANDPWLDDPMPRYDCGFKCIADSDGDPLR
jgi:hypothetical protein